MGLWDQLSWGHFDFKTMALLTKWLQDQSSWGFDNMGLWNHGLGTFGQSECGPCVFGTMGLGGNGT